LAIFVISLAVASIGLILVFRRPRTAGDGDETDQSSSDSAAESGTGDRAQLVGVGAATSAPGATLTSSWGDPGSPAAYPGQPPAWPAAPAAPPPYPYGTPPGYPPQAGYPSAPGYPPPYPPPGSYPAYPAPPPPGYMPPAYPAHAVPPVPPPAPPTPATPLGPASGDAKQTPTSDTNVEAPGSSD
jgi:hypothetical protein